MEVENESDQRNEIYERFHKSGKRINRIFNASIILTLIGFGFGGYQYLRKDDLPGKELRREYDKISAVIQSVKDGRKTLEENLSEGYFGALKSSVYELEVKKEELEGNKELQDYNKEMESRARLGFLGLYGSTAFICAIGAYVVINSLKAQKRIHRELARLDDSIMEA